MFNQIQPKRFSKFPCAHRNVISREIRDVLSVCVCLVWGFLYFDQTHFLIALDTLGLCVLASVVFGGINTWDSSRLRLFGTIPGVNAI